MIDRLPSLVALAALALGLGCGGQASVPMADPIRPVLYVDALGAGESQPSQLSGQARAGQQASLSFRVAGTVESISVAVGDQVEAGSEIARLDPADYRLQLKEAEASAAQAEAAARRAEADYDRVRGLYENENASKSELDAGRAAAESSRAQVEAAEQRVERLRRQVAYTRLVAPMAGAIATMEVDVNENVGAGQPITLLAADSRPEVDVAVPASSISRIREGDPAEVRFGDLGERVFPARVTEVGVAASAAGTFPVTVRLEEMDETVRPGMAASVTLHLRGDRRDGVYVPSVAVGEDDAGRFVFVLEGEGETAKAVKRPVEVGRLDGEGLEILAGLRPGERVVTAGVRRIEDGQEVRPRRKELAGP